MGARRIFPGVGKSGGLEAKVPQRGVGVERWWKSGGGAPEADEKL